MRKGEGQKIVDALINMHLGTVAFDVVMFTSCPAELALRAAQAAYDKQKDKPATPLSWMVVHSEALAFAQAEMGTG